MNTPTPEFSFNRTTATITLKKSYIDWAFVCFIFALHLFIYGAELFHTSLCGDEIRESMDIIPDQYIAQKRWGIVIWKEIFGYGYLPFLHITIYSLISALCVLLQVKTLSFRTVKSQLVYGIIYACCPLWQNLLIFSQQADAFALSMLLASLSVFILIQHRSKWDYLTCPLLMTLSIAMYQTAIFYASTIWLAWYTRQCLSETTKSFIHHGLKLSFVIISGFILHHFISMGIINSGAVTPEFYHKTADYQNGFFIHWRNAFESGSPIPILAQIYRSVTSTLLTIAGYPTNLTKCGTLFHLYVIITTAATIFIIFQILKKKTSRQWKWITISSIILLITFPYLPYIMTYGYGIEQRLYISIAISSACICSLFVEGHYHKTFGKIASVCILSFLVLKSTYQATIITRNSAWNFERTKSQFHEFKSAAQAIARKHNLPKCKVWLAGDWWPIKSLPLRRALDVAEAPLIQGCCQPFAVKYYAAYFGCGNIDRLEIPDTPEELKQLLKTKPVWPDPESIFIYKDDIIINVFKTHHD